MNPSVRFVKRHPWITASILLFVAMVIADKGKTNSPQVDAEKAELATPHINKVPATPIPPSNGPGSIFITIPSREPILKGNVVAANFRGKGMGAVICPDSNTFGAWMDSETPSSGGGSNPEDNMSGQSEAEMVKTLKPYGCSYVPPGTPMVSEGGNPSGSLAVVNVNLSDGTVIKGVVFPNSIVQNQ